MKDEKEESLRDKGEFYKSKKIEQKRSMKLQNNERNLLELLQNLDNDYENLVIIVEGKRDESILRKLGIKAPIIRTQSRLPRYRLIEKIVDIAGSENEVLILTDYDQEGIEICNYIERELELNGVKTLKGVRIKIRRYMTSWRCIEEFVNLLKRSDSPVVSHTHD